MTLRLIVVVGLAVGASLSAIAIAVVVLQDGQKDGDCDPGRLSTRGVSSDSPVTVQLTGTEWCNSDRIQLVWIAPTEDGAIGASTRDEQYAVLQNVTGPEFDVAAEIPASLQLQNGELVDTGNEHGFVGARQGKSWSSIAALP